MILLDGIFIVELFLENHFFQLRDRKETIFENHWMHKDLLHDMLLLENQLPISIMNDLLNFVDFSFLNEGVKFTIYGLAHKFFKDVGITQKIPLTERCCEAGHFVDFLLILHAPPQREPRMFSRSATERCCEARHFVECLGILHAPEKPKEPQKSASKKFEYTRSATELHEAGVKFRDADGNCFFDVLFDNGVLTIPKLNVNDTTETFFRNLIAYEQCGYRGYYSEDITSYVILMDSLINTSSDVDLLVKSKIIENNLGSSELVADLFNNLYKDVVTEANIFYFDKLCEELNKYSRDELHKWKARFFNWRVMLGRDYFSNPWSGMSVLAAVLLLILTVIQTVCSILQVQ